MLSSHNLYKQSETIVEKNHRKIETTYVTSKKDHLYFNENGEISEKEQADVILTEHHKQQMEKFNSDIDETKEYLKHIFKKERDKFFLELREIKAKVIEQAEIEGNEIKNQAYQEGLKEGQLDGYESGLENGYQVGLENANSLKMSALYVIEQSRMEMVAYQKEKQHEFIELATTMAEKVLHTELSLSDFELKVLLTPILNKLDKVDNFITIFVTKANQEQTILFLEEQKETYPDMKYVVLVDETLEKNGCIVETNFEMIDLQLKKQLDKMAEDISNGEKL